jgi:hypothetical protein
MTIQNAQKLTALAVLAIVAVGLGSRLYFLTIRGGSAPDQIAWAIETYFGGLSEYYLLMRDLILAWQAEPHPWGYLPGYPMFLAALYSMGIEDLYDVRVVQLMIDALAIVPLYYVLVRIGKSTYPALLGCLTYAISPWWGAGSTYLLAESLLPAIVISLLAAMTWVRENQPRAITWLLLGLFAATLPFFRSEMMLLFIPLAAWAWLVAPKNKRLVSAMCVVAGFVLPLCLWAIRNYYIHGQFILAPPVKWYVAWSGLGQMDNDFGYAADDARAGALLASKGIVYHSSEAEKYWFQQYMEAWARHPMHVVETILYRFNQILGRADAQNIQTSPILLNLYGAMAILAPGLIFLLVRAKRFTDAFIIALPMIYALASLGILYVERRYVRYAGLTYLLAFQILFSDLTMVFLRSIWDRFRIGQQQF